MDKRALRCCRDQAGVERGAAARDLGCDSDSLATLEAWL
jgi:hypothetical protein